MPFPAEVAAEFLERALEAARAASLPARLEAELIAALLRGGRIADAVERARLLAPRLTELASFNDARSAEAMVPLVRAAIDGGDDELAASLKKEFSRLLVGGSREDWVTSARAAEAIGERGIMDRLPPPDKGSQLCLDLLALEELRRKHDPAWEPLFDSLEERLEWSGSNEHFRAFLSYLPCGLVRAAYRHWLRGGKPASTDLVEALWRDELGQQYRSVVESAHRGAEDGDWNAVTSLAALAKAQLRAGDPDGALASAELARRVAEAGVVGVLAIPTTMSAKTRKRAAPESPAIGIWYLAPLIPLELALGDEVAARAVLARCESLLEQNAVASAPRADRDQGRVTALISLESACVEARWFDEALRFARLQGDGSEASVAFQSGSPELARSVFEELSAEGRVQLALMFCQTVSS